MTARSSGSAAAATIPSIGITAHWLDNDASYIFNVGGSNAKWGEGDTINFYFDEEDWQDLLNDPNFQQDMAMFIAFMDSLSGKHASGQTFDFEAFEPV